jgi:hypothetical protein
MMTVAMLICPTSSHLTTVDVDANVVAVAAVAAMMLNVTTTGETIGEGRGIHRHHSIRSRGGEEG